MITNPSVQATIKNGNLLNKKIIEICQKADKTTKDILLAYNQPVSEKCPFIISFVGRFKTGKSSLINALIGAEILPTKATTATSVVTRIFYGKTAGCWLRTKDEDKKISIEEGKDIILNYEVKDEHNPVEIIFELPVPWIKGNIELRDTPGMDDSSQDGKLEKIAMDALADTDLCVCVYDASTMISQKERERTQRICKMMSGNLVYAVNCTNRLNSMESVNQVEQLAKNFFGSMSYSMSGMGKYYMISSAPKMIELDGFDKWIQEFVSGNNLSLLNKARRNTGNGQAALYREEFSAEVHQYAQEIDQQIYSLTQKHDEIVRRMKQANMQSAQKEADEFRRRVTDLDSNFADTTAGLREKIQECKNKGTDYAGNTKAATQEYFIERYKSTIGNYGNYFSKDDIHFIRQAFEVVSFPGMHTKAVKATAGEKVGWGGIGAAIGGFLGGPLGAIIGAAIGGYIGNADTTTDDSVDNTMSFIRSTVVPLMKNAMNDRISVVTKNIKNKGNQSCNSGLETILSETKSVKQMLRTY